MMKLLKAVPKFIIANLAVVLVILMLPVFLVTDSVEFFDSIMNYLFNNKQ